MKPSPAATAAAPAAPDLQTPPPLVPGWLRALLVVVAALFPGLSAVTNNYTELHCVREAGHVAGGSCLLRRGSLAFAYDEAFFVRDVLGARVVGADEAVPDRARDGGGERVYVDVKGGEAFRLIDNDVWSGPERDAVAARINAFVADNAIPSLDVVFDRRLTDLVRHFLYGLGASGLALVVHNALRRQVRRSVPPRPAGG
jgi:hypothetical protein